MPIFVDAKGIYSLIIFGRFKFIPWNDVVRIEIRGKMSNIERSYIVFGSKKKIILNSRISDFDYVLNVINKNVERGVGSVFVDKRADL
jgi:hypothetical protein